MPIENYSEYIKPGAVFATAAEAYADKNSLYSPELIASIESCYQKMESEGILLEPISYTWDQETSVLTVVKIISDMDLYSKAITFDLTMAKGLSSLAGWSYRP
jgi:hypothetical protein